MRPNCDGGNEDDGDLLQKVPCRHCYPNTSNPAAGHCQPTPLPETPGHSWASLSQSLVGSLFLSPGSWCGQGSVCALPESASPVLCKFLQLYGGIMVTISKRAYAIPRSTAPRAPAPAAGHRRPTPPPETPRHSWACLGQFLVGSLLFSPGSWCAEGFVCALQESVSPVLSKFGWFYGGVHGHPLQGGLCHTQVCCTQSPCGRPLLTRTSTGDTQTQFWLSLLMPNSDLS